MEAPKTTRRAALLISNAFGLSEGWRILLSVPGPADLRPVVILLSWLVGLGVAAAYFSLVFQDTKEKFADRLEFFSASAFAFGVFCALFYLSTTMNPALPSP
jgi:hypothetical protein